MSSELSAHLVGIGVILALWVIYRLAGKRWNPAGIFEGADHRSSTSKFQFFLWTVVAIYGYASLYAARLFVDAVGEKAQALSIPANLLAAMGLSAATMVAAKGVTTALARSGQIQKPVAGTPAQPSQLGGLFTDDDGFVDLSKLQLLAWTFIATTIFLISSVRAVHDLLNTAAKDRNAGALPDIDRTLMILMGLGQGAYLGKKIASTDVARLSGLSIANGPPGTVVNVTGTSFGAAQGGNIITLDGATLTSVASWSDTEIKFAIPATQANDTKWPPGQRVNIGVIVGGQPSANTLPFTVA